MQHFDIATQIERDYMDLHTDDWLVPDEDIELLSLFEYACWQDDCYEENN